MVDYRLGPHVPEPAVIPDIYVFGPDGFQRPVKASKLAAGSFRVRLTIGRRQGLFRVRPLVESRAFPEIGLYRQEEEMTDYGSNDFVLRQISAATGGRFNPDPKDVFDPNGRSIPVGDAALAGTAGVGGRAESGGVGVAEGQEPVRAVVRLNAGDGASALQQNHVAPSPIHAAESFARSHHSEAGSLTQCEARRILRKDSGLQRPDALALRFQNQSR